MQSKLSKSSLKAPFASKDWKAGANFHFLLKAPFQVENWLICTQLKSKFTFFVILRYLKKGAFDCITSSYAYRTYAEAEIWYESFISTLYYILVTPELKGAFTFVKEWSKFLAYCPNHAIFGVKKAPFFRIRFWALKGAKKVIYRFSAFRRYFCVNFGTISRENALFKNV